MSFEIMWKNAVKKHDIKMVTIVPNTAVTA